MSRSYKKTPVIKYAPSGKIGKKFANRRVRRFKGDIPDGYVFLKKIYDPWNVHDVVQRYTLSDALQWRTKCISYYNIGNWNSLSEEEQDINKCIQNWKKWYWRK